jgi:hypothetical protein
VRLFAECAEIACLFARKPRCCSWQVVLTDCNAAAQQANCTGMECSYQSRRVSKKIAPLRHWREQNEPIAYTGTMNMILMMYLCVHKQQALSAQVCFANPGSNSLANSSQRLTWKTGSV